METLKQMFSRWAGEPCTQCLTVAAGASPRHYYRLQGPTRRCIGTVAADLRENEAFFALTQHLRDRHLPVPELYAIHPDRRHYLQQDLGDDTLYSILYDKKRQGGGFDAQMLQLYRQALADLAAIQQAGRNFDFSHAYPRSDFDRRAILWDLNYFKYNFLKLAHIDFDEERLEDDLQHLADLLLAADCSYLLYRDFNPRNIMVVQPQMLPATSHQLPTLYYIDYQGARRGAAQYDVASLLYSAKSDLPQAIRDELLRHYLDVRGFAGDERQRWVEQYHLYALVRILQTLGAYGYRGLFERKDYFLQSVPLGISNLRQILQQTTVKGRFPEIEKVVGSGKWTTGNGESGPASAHLPHSTLHSPLDQLTVTVQSFSFKQGLPQDPSGNGGGHIFDCRALPNPGRYQEYKAYTGRDLPVVQFLDAQPEMARFLDHAMAIVDQSVDKYIERNFTHLMVSFGCTGGQHRSVYCAERLARKLKDNHPDIRVHLLHREQSSIPPCDL